MLQAPRADVIERENEIEVVLEIPGMQPEDIDIDVENNVLTVTGEKSEEREEEEGTYHLSERHFGRFNRSFVLPRDVEPDGIEARCQDGLLTVKVPKSERARRRRIEVQRGDGAAARSRRAPARSGRAMTPGAPAAGRRVGGIPPALPGPRGASSPAQRPIDAFPV